MTRAEHAAELFHGGYNCAQAVAMAFADLVQMDEKQVAKLVSGFGGGMGRMREVCGAVTGMFFIASTLYGYDEPNHDRQMQTYSLIQELAGQFREVAGSIVCRELLENPPSDPVPSARTEAYYAQRPCVRMVYLAASILDDYISKHPFNP